MIKKDHYISYVNDVIKNMFLKKKVIRKTFTENEEKKIGYTDYIGIKYYGKNIHFFFSNKNNNFIIKNNFKYKYNSMLYLKILLMNIVLFP